MCGLNSNYLISFCGVHGAGKTTLEMLISEKYNLHIPTKSNLSPQRMIDYNGLFAYLDNYYFQVTKNTHNSLFCTSRFGLVDILIYAEALNKLDRISSIEKNDIIKKCVNYIEGYPFPKYLINLTCDFDILWNRIEERDKEYQNNFVRDKKKVQEITDEYHANFTCNIFSNKLLEEIISRYLLSDCLCVLDSSSKTPKELIDEIILWKNVFVDECELKK